MADPIEDPGGVRSVRAERLSTGDGGGGPTAEDVCVIEEAAVTIDVEGVESYALLCTPTDRQELAVGFLFTEGLIDGPADIRVIKECEDDPLTVRVRLVDRVPRIGDPGRNLLIVSSCGACGSENLRERIAALPGVGNAFRIEAGLLRPVFEGLRGRQHLFERCGGAHAAAVFDETGRIVSFAEDVGRHCALDKAIGRRLLAGAGTAGLGVAITSRLSLEIVGKCARGGIELLAAVSAPTSLAIDVAERCGITLCAFVRETRATVFTRPERVLAAGG